jgi:hypothetical protein
VDEEMTDELNPAEAELAQLADGSLPEPRRAELRAQVKGSPELTAALAEQERAVMMLRALDQPAPAALRARVDELTGAGGTARRPLVGWRRPLVRWRRALLLPGATALAVVVAAVVIVAGGGSGGPTVPQTAGLALAAATLPAPAVNPADARELKLTGAGIPFPNYGGAGEWTVTGARTDRLDGRTVTTVFYSDRAGDKVGYAIASGAPLAGVPGNTVRIYGTTFTLARRGSARLITWVRSGHTCVIAGRAVSYRTLRELAGADERETGTTSQAALDGTGSRAEYL